MKPEEQLHRRLKVNELRLKKAESKLETLDKKERCDQRGYYSAMHYETTKFIIELNAEVNLIKEILDVVVTGPEEFVNADNMYQKYTKNMLAKIQVYPGLKGVHL